MLKQHSVARVLLVSALGVLAALLVIAPAAMAKQPRRAIRGAHPAFARKSKSLGDATSHVTAKVYLQPQGGIDALKRDVVAASTPGSASFHRFLTPTQYRATYMPSAAAVSSVKSWLAAAGMKVTSVEHARRYVVASGSTSAAEKAFGTSLERFRHRKQLVRAPADTVTVPADVAGKVLTITGLDTTAYRLKPKAKQPPAFLNARPCSSWYGQVTAKYQADFQTPLPPFKNEYRKYACADTRPASSVRLRGRQHD